MSQDHSKNEFEKLSAGFLAGRITRRHFIGQAAKLGISAALLSRIVSLRAYAAEGNLLDSSPDYPNEAPITKERIAFLKNKPYKGRFTMISIPRIAKPRARLIKLIPVEILCRVCRLNNLPDPSVVPCFFAKAQSP